MRKLLLIALLASAANAQTINTWTISEQFGTNWPNQPIEFPTSLTADPGTADKVMLSINGGSATEVFYQWEPVSANGQTVCYGKPATAGGCIIVAFSPLNANETRTWTLQVGTKTATAPSNPASLATVGNNYEITNGLTGVRIVTAAANTTPFNKAPIQGVQLISGAWTGAGASANLLYSESSSSPGNAGLSLTTPMYTATAYSVSTVVSGPLKTVLQVSYAFNRPRYFYGSLTINPAGTGHFTGTYTVWAGLQTVGIDEDTDMQQQYFIPTYAQVAADTERHRGANSGSQQFNSQVGYQGDPRCGYNPPGTITGATNASPAVITLSTPNVAVNGNTVQIQGINSVVPDGIYFVKLLTSTTYALYSVPALTTPFSTLGTATYTSGGTLKPSYQGYAITDLDAQMDLTYSTDRPNHYYCSYGFGSSDGYAGMILNYPTGGNKSGGFYSFMYNSAGPGSSDLIGMYQGQVGPVKMGDISGAGSTPSQPGIYTSNAHFVTGSIAGGIQVPTFVRASTGFTATLIHRNWGIYVDINANLPSQALGLEPIGNIQNILSGINLSDIANYNLVFPDPVGGFPPLYLLPTAYSTLQGWVKDGTAKCGSTTCYYNLLKNGDSSPFNVALLNLWQTDTTAAVTTALNSMLGGGVNSFTSFSNSLANGDNHFGDIYGFYQLGLNVTSVATPLLNAILLNSHTTTAQKNQAKAILSFGANMFWDSNWWNPNTGEGKGNGNQNSQFDQYQTQLISSIPSQPYLSQFLPTGIAQVQSSFASNWNPSGAVPGSTHYESTFAEPTAENYLTLTRTGNLDFSSPTWQAYGRWELSSLTPPEPRFGGTTGSGGLAIPMRKLYSNGDGNTEAAGAVRMGIMANALQGVNATLAGQLQFGYSSTNSLSQLTGSSQFLSTTSTIDPTISPITPTLASINIPGYHSSERFNFGTANETALWFINGGLYSTNGHRHADDGQVSAYALGAPLAIDWNANLYNPETPGRFSHNSVAFDSELSPALWSADTPSLSAVNAALGSPTNTEFINVSASTHSTGTFTLPADGTVWTRAVRTMNFNPAYPIIYVKDTFSGTSASAGKTLTWNLMAAGSVTSPAGSITPTVRLSAGCQQPAGQLPSNGTVNSLSAGLNAFNFTGVPWVSHPSGGINWDMWQIPTGTTQQFFIGNWGHGCNGTREVAEYQAANKQSVSSLSTPTINLGTNLFHTGQQVKMTNTGGGAFPSGLGSSPTYYVINATSTSLQLSTTMGGSAIAFTGGTLPLQIFALMNESQHILRVHDSAGGPLVTVIAPYAKGATPTRTVTAQSCGTQIVMGSETTCFNDSAATYTNGTVSNLTTYDTSTNAGFGMTASGGSQEAVLTTPTTISWTISGAIPGTRQLFPPAGTWVASPSLVPVGGSFNVSFPGGLQAAPQVFTLTQSSASSQSSGIGGNAGFGGTAGIQ